ncbi:uncharacterized protein BKA78DRAFT_144111 [Phyllosticta capitalensis]|uniref:uncharacterized protein n=1 Tax=Phyllosticta capitalensis TaxID=121624 RepID=UPI00312F7091
MRPSWVLSFFEAIDQLTAVVVAHKTTTAPDTSCVMSGHLHAPKSCTPRHENSPPPKAFASIVFATFILPEISDLHISKPENPVDQQWYGCWRRVTLDDASCARSSTHTAQRTSICTLSNTSRHVSGLYVRS